jgi:tetraacyldisaccharide-1-P 4'-kinase
MLQGAPVALPPGAPHVIVVGNEKGGVGKTTIAMHVAVGLLKLGQRVSTIDRQHPAEPNPLHRKSPCLGQLQTD